MVNLTPYSMYNLNNLNDESTRVAHQMSTGRLLQNGSDDSVKYTEILNIEDKLRTYQNLQTQVANTVAQNEVADSTMTQVKEQMDTIRNELMKALNSGMNRSTREAMAVNIDGIKTTLRMLANTAVNGEYVFTGSDTTIKPYIEDSQTGKVEYVGDGILRRVAIDPGVYRERGIHGFELMMYNTDTATDGQTLEFYPDDRIIDENGHEWKFLSGNYNEAGDNEYIYLDGDPTKDRLRVKVSTSELNGDLQGSPYKFETEPVTKEGRILMTKHNYFDDIDRIINALNGFDRDGATVLENKEITEILSEELDNTNEAYDAVNVSHAKLGGRDKIFINASERIASQIKHFDVLLNDAGAADLSKVAMESQSLELLYTSLYSTITKMNNLSLVNFVK